MKTAREWFAQLPEPIRSEAMENAKDLDEKYDSLPITIICEISWQRTSQGTYYWSGIYYKAEQGHYDKQTNDMRKLTRTDFKRIHDIACTTWKKRLTDAFSDFAFKDEIEVTEDFYQEMRNACTAEQHELFDEIFGAEQKFKVGDWVTVTELIDPPSWVTREDKRTFQITGGIKDGFYATLGDGMYGLKGWKMRHATPEEIAKAKYYPEGTPCLVRDFDDDGWNLRYADGNGEFYAVGRKSGNTNTWKQHMRLDINNLPTS